MPRLPHLYSLIQVLTTVIVTTNVNCPSHYTGRVSTNSCPSLLVIILHVFFLKSHDLASIYRLLLLVHNRVTHREYPLDNPIFVHQLVGKKNIGENDTVGVV